MQIKPMCKKYKVYSKKPFNEDYSEVTFSVKLSSNGYALIPRLKYKRIFANSLTKYNNGATGYNELDIPVKQLLKTRLITYIHDKLYYGELRGKIYKRYYNYIYDNIIFNMINK